MQLICFTKIEVTIVGTVYRISNRVEALLHDKHLKNCVISGSRTLDVRQVKSVVLYSKKPSITWINFRFYTSAQFRAGNVRIWNRFHGSSWKRTPTQSALRNIESPFPGQMTINSANKLQRGSFHHHKQGWHFLKSRFTWMLDTLISGTWTVSYLQGKLTVRGEQIMLGG